MAPGHDPQPRPRREGEGVIQTPAHPQNISFSGCSLQEFRLHPGPRIIDIAPFDGSDRREFIDGPGADMLSRDKRYCTQQNIDEIVSLCGEMPLQSVWVNYMNRFAHLGFTDDHYCLMRAVGWVWRKDNVSEYRKMMKYRPHWDEWSPPPHFPSDSYALSHPSFKNSEAALRFMEQHFGRAAE